MSRLAYSTAIAALVLCACNEEKPTETPAKADTSAAADTSPGADNSGAPAATAPSAETVDGTLLEVGAAAPAIDATAHDGEKVSLEKLKGKPVIVYFYPKDDTPGCTIEAQQIRDSYEDLSKTGAVVLGVSSDSNTSHSEFAKKYSLPFKLLPDSDHAIAKAFGVSLRGGKAARVTFLIDKQGKIAKVFPKVNPDGHAKELLEALKALPEAAATP
ncbi:MAG: peroxiredoxin [Polyangiaceae bacterium]|nr:peroxiredoxin [Myxococcales bacterium]MCB9590825.1 peroxiredoxin [Polyangiaceae bacterium]